MASLTVIEGIGDAYEATLKEHGISSVGALLEQGATKNGRSQIAEKTGISEKLVLKWTNHADLMRIKGVGGEYSELLEAAGVDTVPELATRNAANLHAKLVEVNGEKQLVRNVAAASQVADWVEQAKSLPRVIQY